MFNPTTIQTCLSGLIGFRQHYNTAYDRYDSDIVASAAGLYIDNSAHSLITVENISAIAENFSKTDVSAYSNAITYAKGDIVKDSSIIYESLVANNLNHTPASSASYWRVTNLTSAYLRRLVNSASINLFNKVFAQKKLYEVAKTLLTDTSLYDGVGNLARKITKFSRFVGFRISPNFNDTVINISWAGFQFDTINPAFKLYVYHSSQNEPIKEITLALSKAISFEWKELTELLSLNYSSSATNTKGYFYIGYYEDDLVGQAIWKEQSFSGAACASCNNLDSYLWRQWNKYFSIQSFYVEEAWLDAGRNLFVEDKAIELGNQNWGMNLKLQVQCDVSDVICRSKMAFGDALVKQVVHDLLRDMAYSMRDNQKKEKVSQLAHYALENKENHTKGVIAELDTAVKNVSFDLSSMSSVCLPCNTGGAGISISSVF
jgi:hypothetical protein